MKILLSEGSGLTSRQVATRLGALGHRVEILSSTALCLARFTRHVRRVHAVPNFGLEPLAWMDAATKVCRESAIDVLFPTQEQVAILSAHSILGGSEFQVQAHDGNADATAPVRVTVVTTTLEPLPHS